jgi:carbon storage regulator CsrA
MSNATLDAILTAIDAIMLTLIYRPDISQKEREDLAGARGILEKASNEEKRKGQRMLALSRKTGEWIQIETPDGPIVVMILAMKPGRVRIGIDAPRSYRVMRNELIPTSEPDLRGGTEE